MNISSKRQSEQDKPDNILNLARPEQIESQPKQNLVSSEQLHERALELHDSQTPISPDPVLDQDSWLWATSIPCQSQIRLLVENYFSSIHPLRCFGFLHKPSFMRKLDNEEDVNKEEDSLLLIVCALGALIYAARDKNSVHSPHQSRAAGKKWACRAKQQILGHLDKIHVENLMAAVLLHDYDLRMGNWSSAFMLSGLIARMTQALQINLEHSMDILCEDPSLSASASTKESRRRLMWCCYITDSLVGSGVDQLTLTREVDIKIQLPCNERNFLLQTPCITEALEKGQVLPFVDVQRILHNPSENMGIRAAYIRHIAVRRRVLKYIKHLSTAMMPWLPDSEFALLDADCKSWLSALPESLQFTPNALYIRKETSQVGALCALHLMYHQTMCDLYRIGTPALYKLRGAFHFPAEQSGFLSHVQDQLFEHATALARIISEAHSRGAHGLADSWIPTIAYDSCRIMLYYATQLVDPNAYNKHSIMCETIKLVRGNIEALKYMRRLYTVADLLSAAAESMLEQVETLSASAALNQNVIPDDPYAEQDHNEHTVPGTPVQSTPEYVLNPLSIYRMARKGIVEKHAPERQGKTATSITSRQSPYQYISNSRTSTTASGGNINLLSTETDVADGNHPISLRTGYEDLLTFFTSDPSGWAWQPSDTAVDSHFESIGLPPWEPTDVGQQLDAWMSIFSEEQRF